MIENEKKPNIEKVPEKVKQARNFLSTINNGLRKVKPSDEHKIAEAKLILAIYGCQLEGLPITVTNLIMILGPDATETLKYLTPETHSYYGIVDTKI